MSFQQFRTIRWVYTGVLLLALLGFLWRGVRPDELYTGMELPEITIVRSIAWVGFVVTVGLLMLPWWPWQGVRET